MGGGPALKKETQEGNTIPRARSMNRGLSRHCVLRRAFPPPPALTGPGKETPHRPAHGQSAHCRRPPGGWRGEEVKGGKVLGWVGK